MSIDFTAKTRTGIFLKVLDYLQMTGHSASDICHMVDLSYTELQKQSITVSEEDAYKLWHLAVKHSNISDLGFHVGRTYNLEMFGLLGMILQNSTDINDVLENACQYAILATSVIQLNVRKDDEHLYLELIPSIEGDVPYYAERSNQVCLYVLGLLHRAYALLTIRNDINIDLFLPYGFNVNHTLDRYYKIHESSTSNANYIIRVKKDYGVHPVINSNPIVQGFLLEKANEILDHKANHNWNNTVRRLIIQKFNGKFLDVQTVADHFNISVRSLQRNLNEEDTNYKEVINDIKFQLAQHYLKKSMSVKETSFLLGFNSQSNFSRAFKRWYGASATEFQDKIKSQAAE